MRNHFINTKKKVQKTSVLAYTNGQFIRKHDEDFCNEYEYQLRKKAYAKQALRKPETKAKKKPSTMTPEQQDAAFFEFCRRELAKLNKQ